MKRLAPIIILMLSSQAFAQSGDANAAAARAAMHVGDYAEAYYLWRGLAVTGDADALYNLGWMYHNGYGLVIDDVEAQHWWEQADARGSVDAMYALGNLHRFGGRGVAVDGPRAVDYFLRAATQGDDESALLIERSIELRPRVFGQTGHPDVFHDADDLHR